MMLSRLGLGWLEGRLEYIFLGGFDSVGAVVVSVLLLVGDYDCDGVMENDDGNDDDCDCGDGDAVTVDGLCVVDAGVNTDTGPSAIGILVMVGGFVVVGVKNLL